MYSTYIHFKPNINIKERLSCARTQTHVTHTQHSLHIGVTKLKKVDKARFLGVIIDEKLTWDDHINYLESKLLSCIATIKRIRKFIPKFHHKQLYHSIFLPHLIYGITSWGGACPSKLEKVFSLQKRCIRILFGNKVSFDHAEFYETCARARPLTSINTHEINYELENTKPLFNNNNLLTVHNLYKLQIITETFKIKKFSCPSPLNDTLKLSSMNRRVSLLKVPQYSLMTSKNNFHYKAASIWNKIMPKLLERPDLDANTNLVIPGSCLNSDLTTPMGYIKHKTKAIL